MGDSYLHQSSEVTELISSIRKDWLLIQKSGAFVFDIDETLLSPDAYLDKVSEVQTVLVQLLNTGIQIGLISGSPGAVVENRIIRPLKQVLPREIFQKLTIYVNGGSTRYNFDAQASYLEDQNYTAENRIPASQIHQVKDIIVQFIHNKMNLSETEFQTVCAVWMKKREEQWRECKIQFDDLWIQNKKWNIQFWDDEEMASVKAKTKSGKTSFPFINTRRPEFDVQGKLAAVSGFTPSGFYTLQKDKGDSMDLDIRDQLIQKLESSALSFKKAGRSSIDITKKGTDKASALTNFIKTKAIDTQYVYYFGDEFFPGGNDQPIAESPELKILGIHIISVNQKHAPKDQRIIWLGASRHATLEFLKSVI